MLTAPGDRAESSLKTEILLVGRPELTFFSLCWALAIQFSPERTRATQFSPGEGTGSPGTILYFTDIRARTTYLLTS